ncbi:MAG: hypothetical protein L6R40_008798, partial [Gallowayella cf. fulva]
MDALTSLPVLSFLLIPSMGSYGTSLNLLFFYMTWSTLILSHPPLHIEVLGTLLIRHLFFVLPSTLFLIFDSAVPGLAANLKAQGDDALPAKIHALDGAGKTRSRRLSAVVGTAIWNVAMGAALQAGVEVLFTQGIGLSSALRVTTTLPTPYRVAFELLKGFTLREVLQYYLHRYTLHSPSSPVSQYHESWQHSVSLPYSFVAHYDSPLTWILWRWLPTYGPALLVRFHILNYFLFMVLVSIEET